MQSVDEVLEVDAPVTAVWAQWADMAGLGELVDGVVAVRRGDDGRITWRGRLDGREVEWTSRISVWEPERRIAWTSESGHRDARGEVTFAEAGPGRTRVHVRIAWLVEDGAG